MTYDRIEESTGVPADILGRSAEARAEADDKTEAEVVADWTGADAPAAPAPDVASEPSAPTPNAEASDTPGLPAAEALTGEALVAAAAEAKGIPVSLVERSAQARADADGVPVEDVMRKWVVEAGLASTAVAAAAAAPAEAAPAEPTPAPPEPLAPVEPVVAAEPEELGVEVLEPTIVVEDVPVEEEVVAARGGYPAWLAASLLIIPLIAVMYVLVVPNQPSCGSAGQVAIDPATGAHANCDGSAYGETEASDVIAGGEIYAASCAVCHGDAGQGGAGPALAGGAVLETFPEGSCDSHIAWVTLGSAGWPEDTYGAQGKPVQGGMPPAGLTEDEIAQVTLYERVALGNQDEAAGEEDCGFLDEEASAAG
jgi:mono/diheme cytochrome c family protein